MTLDGQNLNDQTLKYFARNEDQPRAFYKNGAQYYLNLRFRGELTGTLEACERERVAPISLDALAGAAWDLGGGDDLAAVALDAQLPGEAISAGPAS